MNEILAAIATAESNLSYAATLIGSVHARTHLSGVVGERNRRAERIGKVRVRLARNIVQLSNIKATMESLAKEIE